MHTPSSSPSGKEPIFIDNQGDSLPIFVDVSGSSSNGGKSIRILRRHAAEVVDNPSKAKILIVDPSTVAARNLVRDWQDDESRVILSPKWISHSVENRGWPDSYNKWGGFQLSILGPKERFVPSDDDLESQPWASQMDYQVNFTAPTLSIVNHDATSLQFGEPTSLNPSAEDSSPVVNHGTNDDEQVTSSYSKPNNRKRKTVPLDKDTSSSRPSSRQRTIPSDPKLLDAVVTSSHIASSAHGQSSHSTTTPLASCSPGMASTSTHLSSSGNREETPLFTNENGHPLYFWFPPHFKLRKKIIDIIKQNGGVTVPPEVDYDFAILDPRSPESDHFMAQVVQAGKTALPPRYITECEYEKRLLEYALFQIEEPKQQPEKPKSKAKKKRS